MGGQASKTAGGAEPDTPTSDDELARLIDDHLQVQIIAIGHVAPYGQVHVSDHAVLAHCGFPSVFNRGTALDLAQPDLALTEMERFFGDLPHAIWFRTAALGDALDGLLRGRGYRPLPPVAGMARDLPAEGLPPLEPHHAQLLTDPALASPLAEVVTSGYGFGIDDRIVVEDVIRNVLRHAKPFDHGAVYGVRDDPDVVSMGLLLCTADVAGVTTLATLPRYRHRGMATVIVARVLNDAAALGYRLAGVVTNPDSGQLFADLGFRPVSSYRVYRTLQR